MHLPINMACCIGLLLQRRQNAIPDAGLPPALEPTRYGAYCAISLRQIAPGSARARNPQHPIDDPTMISSRAARLRLLWWQQRFKP
jgi:hypothetical protein